MAEVDARFAAAIAKRAPLLESLGDVLAFRQAAGAAVQGDEAAYCAMSAAWMLERYRGRGLEDPSSTMPRVAITLADLRDPTLSIVCEPCGRRGRCNVERLIAAYGADAKLPNLLVTLAACAKARSFQRLRPLQGGVRRALA